MSRILDAVTAVLVHDGEVLVMRRQPWLSAFPGFNAFPGGKIDKTDGDNPPACRSLDGVEPRQAEALAREVLEELGWDLPAACNAGLVAGASLLGTALTPPVFPVRFNTHFYRVDLRERPSITIDTNEVAEAFWAPPAELVRRYEAGELLMAPPSLETLRALAADISATTVPRLHFEHRGDGELPMVEQVCGVRHIWVRSHTIPPAQHTNAYILGDMQSHRVLVDPSPADDEEMEKLLAMAQRYGVHEIFLTHHHHDHRERADVMARRMQIPIGMSDDTRGRIWDRTEGKFFEGIPSVNVYREGDVLCRWLGQAVRVIEVPGHDQGQLALMPENRAWCLVGDLIQGLGTVVIAKPEGHMGRYFESLRKIIALDPKVILPSHGAALGTVYRLVETLKHREARELQILDLHNQGRDVEEMLPIVYAGVDKALWPLARMNIEGHLDKLREEGRLAAA
ncbi:MBL fold metallo-hydrolase [Solimonas sp. K1W22B-7]|uniref:MBL fold metallo-hydrolase n=1 Tax=Solimonas sp. K1W22B-7 TaxID=2303331 RepID=UPI0013C4850A|nr:MBL fold metallo-hydrolase [Solimonas sp. K1W22B-7]